MHRKLQNCGLCKKWKDACRTSGCEDTRHQCARRSDKTSGQQRTKRSGDTLQSLDTYLQATSISLIHSSKIPCGGHFQMEIIAFEGFPTRVASDRSVLRFCFGSWFRLWEVFCVLDCVLDWWLDIRRCFVYLSFGNFGLVGGL